jgi:hypothetical protein
MRSENVAKLTVRRSFTWSKAAAPENVRDGDFKHGLEVTGE